MNKIMLSGRLGKDDPALKTVTGGKSVCNFSMAVPRPFAEKKNSDWFNVVAWGKLGENAAKYLFHGARTVVCGYMSTRSYTDKAGVKRTVYEVVADTIEYFDKKGNPTHTEQADPGDMNTAFGEAEKEMTFEEFETQTDAFTSIEDDDDIPF